MGFKIIPSSQFPYDFNMVGRLGPLHEEGQALGLHEHWAYRVMGLGLKATEEGGLHGRWAYRVVGLGPKVTVLTNISAFS